MDALIAEDNGDEVGYGVVGAGRLLAELVRIDIAVVWGFGFTVCVLFAAY